MVQKNFLKRLLKQLVFCTLLPITYASAVTTLDLPDIGESTGTLLSPEFERRLGQAFLNQIRRQTDVINDPEVETYIQSIGYRLVAQSDNSSQLFTFFVIDDPQINAFAAPGGIVGINTGTITHSETESELAGVIAHEIAHVTQRHMARSAEMTQKMSIPMIAAMLGAILIATQNPDAGAAAIAAVQGGALQAQINFTRGNEEEADRIGMQLLDRAEFNPFGMPSFFTKLQRNSVYMANAPEFLRTHPLTVNRISDTQARAENVTKRPFNESRTYQFIRTKLLVRTFKTPADAIKHFESLLSQSQRDDVPLKYGLALAHMENRDFARAETMLDDLIKNDQENLSLQLARADLEVRQASYDEAVVIYADMLNIYPDYRPLILSYANTLLTAKRPAEARAVLEGFAKYNTPDITYYNYLTRAEAESGRPIEAGMANAEYYFLTGETRVAIEQLRSLLRSQPKPDYYQEEKILSRISQLELELKLERDLNLG
jgi:predicted Zn-dependent protease